MAGPFLTTFPRRRRVLAVPLFLLVVWAFLPIESFNPPRRLLFGVTAALAGKSTGDVLQFIDPLIGTVNGGELQLSHSKASSRDLSYETKVFMKAMFFPAQLCLMVSDRFYL